MQVFAYLKMQYLSHRHLGDPSPVHQEDLARYISATEAETPLAPSSQSEQDHHVPLENFFPFVNSFPLHRAAVPLFGCRAMELAKAHCFQHPAAPQRLSSGGIKTLLSETRLSKEKLPAAPPPSLLVPSQAIQGKADNILQWEIPSRTRSFVHRLYTLPNARCFLEGRDQSCIQEFPGVGGGERGLHQFESSSRSLGWRTE